LVAADAFFDPAEGDGGGTGEIFAEDAGLVGVGGEEEVDNVPRRLDAEFVEIEMGQWKWQSGKVAKRRRGRTRVEVAKSIWAGGL
jgi:hypothetical protein